MIRQHRDREVEDAARVFQVIGNQYRVFSIRYSVIGLISRGLPMIRQHRDREVEDVARVFQVIGNQYRVFSIQYSVFSNRSDIQGFADDQATQGS